MYKKVSTKSTKIDPASVAVATLRRDKQKYPNIHLRNIIYTPQVDILCPIGLRTEDFCKKTFYSATCRQRCLTCQAMLP